jgi:hypothetical protein
VGGGGPREGERREERMVLRGRALVGEQGVDVLGEKEGGKRGPNVFPTPFQVVMRCRMKSTQ